MRDLTDDERQLLELAGRRYRWPGHHDDAIRAESGLSVTRFWQAVNVLLDDPAAAAYSPALVARLRRTRTRRNRPAPGEVGAGR